MASQSVIERGKQRREDIFSCIVNYIRKNKYPPTVREIGDIVGFKSTSSVYSHLAKLQYEGRLNFNEECPRTIVVPGYAFVKIPKGMTEKELEKLLEKYEDS